MIRPQLHHDPHASAQAAHYIFTGGGAFDGLVGGLCPNCRKRGD